MQSCYVDYKTRAIADLVDYYGLGMLITRINVPVKERGKGAGRKLLAEIVADADRTHTTLFLEIVPTGGMTEEQLTAWYGRYGFKYWKGVFRRRPRWRSIQENPIYPKRRFPQSDVPGEREETIETPLLLPPFTAHKRRYTYYSTRDIFLSVTAGKGYYSSPRENLDDFDSYSTYETALLKNDHFILPSEIGIAEFDAAFSGDLIAAYMPKNEVLGLRQALSEKFRPPSSGPTPPTDDPQPPLPDVISRAIQGLPPETARIVQEHLRGMSRFLIGTRRRRSPLEENPVYQKRRFRSSFHLSDLEKALRAIEGTYEFHDPEHRLADTAIHAASAQWALTKADEPALFLSLQQILNHMRQDYTKKPWSIPEPIRNAYKTVWNYYIKLWAKYRPPNRPIFRGTVNPIYPKARPILKVGDVVKVIKRRDVLEGAVGRVKWFQFYDGSHQCFVDFSGKTRPYNYHDLMKSPPGGFQDFTENPIFSKKRYGWGPGEFRVGDRVKIVRDTGGGDELVQRYIGKVGLIVEEDMVEMFGHQTGERLYKIEIRSPEFQLDTVWVDEADIEHFDSGGYTGNPVFPKKRHSKGEPKFSIGQKVMISAMVSHPEFYMHLGHVLDRKEYPTHMTYKVEVLGRSAGVVWFFEDELLSLPHDTNIG
jgi:hypothetical protein